MSILRDHYRRVYVEALEEKIDEQRKNIKEMQMKALKRQERQQQNLLVRQHHHNMLLNDKSE